MSDDKELKNLFMDLSRKIGDLMAYVGVDITDGERADMVKIVNDIDALVVKLQTIAGVR